MLFSNSPLKSQTRIVIYPLIIFYSWIQIVTANTTKYSWEAQTWGPPEIVKVHKNYTESGVVIFLHDLGSHGKAWSSPVLRICPPYLKLICPTAKEIPNFLHNDSDMLLTSWFHENAKDVGMEHHDEVKHSTDFIHSLIDKEIENGIPSTRIAIVGFAQGAALAIEAALTCTKKLGAIIAYSGWMPADHFIKFYKKENKDIPILQGHGDKDEVIPMHMANVTSLALKQISKNHEYRIYPNTGHIINADQYMDIKKYLIDHFPPLESH